MEQWFIALFEAISPVGHYFYLIVTKIHAEWDILQSKKSTCHLVDKLCTGDSVSKLTQIYFYPMNSCCYWSTWTDRQRYTCSKLISTGQIHHVVVLIDLKSNGTGLGFDFGLTEVVLTALGHWLSEILRKKHGFIYFFPKMGYFVFEIQLSDDFPVFLQIFQTLFHR